MLNTGKSSQRTSWSPVSKKVNRKFVLVGGSMYQPYIESATALCDMWQAQGKGTYSRIFKKLSYRHSYKMHHSFCRQIMCCGVMAVSVHSFLFTPRSNSSRKLWLKCNIEMTQMWKQVKHTLTVCLARNSAVPNSCRQQSVTSPPQPSPSTVHSQLNSHRGDVFPQPSSRQPSPQVNLELHKLAPWMVWAVICLTPY